MDCEDFSLIAVFVTSSFFSIMGALKGKNYYSPTYGGHGCSNVIDATVTNYIHCDEDKYRIIVSYPVELNDGIGYRACLLDKSCKNIFNYDLNSEQKIYQCSENYPNSCFSLELSHELEEEAFFLYATGTFLTFLVVIRLFYKELKN